MNCGDGARPRHENFRHPGGRRQIAGDRLLAGVLRQDQKGDDQCEDHGEAPEQELRRHRLKQNHLSRLPLLLKRDRLGSKQSAPFVHAYSPCYVVADAGKLRAAAVRVLWESPQG